jgi:hypothetical protein
MIGFLRRRNLKLDCERKKATWLDVVLAAPQPSCIDSVNGQVLGHLCTMTIVIPIRVATKSYHLFLLVQ